MAENSDKTSFQKQIAKILEPDSYKWDIEGQMVYTACLIY